MVPLFEGLLFFPAPLMSLLVSDGSKKEHRKTDDIDHVELCDTSRHLPKHRQKRYSSQAKVCLHLL